MSAPFTPAWLAREPRALALLPHRHRDPARRIAAVATAASGQVDPAVLASIEVHTDAQRAHRDALARGGAAAVVTGQQAGLFGGPLYTVYKAASAIVDARALAVESGVPCVPIFWLQDEDHDYDEIASCAVVDRDGALQRIEVPARPTDARRSVAARALGPGVVDALDALADALDGLPAADEVVALLRRCYTPEASPAAAFRGWIEALFAPWGLLVVDPCAPGLAEAAAAVHRHALAQATPISEALQQRTAAIEAAGFRAMVHVRPRSPLCFVHPQGPGGPRHRIEPDPAGGWRLCGTGERVVLEAPGVSFSTSALLRPVLQDTWLPTAAYVGGPGEIAYFAQLAPLYEAFGLQLPVVVPRARFRVHEPAADRLLGQLGLEPGALAQPREALLARLGRARGEEPDPDALLQELITPLQATLARIAPQVGALEPGLDKAIDKTTASVTRASERLVERYRRALARRDGVIEQRLDRLQALLQPGGAPQERICGWPGHGARHGIAGFVSAVIDAIRPLDGTLLELRP